MVETLVESGSRIFQYLQPNVVRKLLDEHASGRRDNHKVLFSLIVLEQWMRDNQRPVAVLS
jgi:asparagine synthase (glutamine-hydrolysing)